MKKKIKLSLLLIVTSGISANASAASVSGGSVNFKGEVVDAACSVSSDSQDQTVVLDQIRTSKLSSFGAANQIKPFNIVLEDCDPLVSQNASVTFSGQADPSNPALLANTAGSGSADGVALQISGPDGAPLDLGSKSSKIILLDGKNTIPLSVDYFRTRLLSGPILSGTVESTATFSITYS